MKKMITIFCAVLLFVCCIPAHAEETELSVRVPSQHEVTVESPEGRVVTDGTVCGDSIILPRHQEQIYWIIPDPGYVLDTLTYGGEDVTDQVKQGTFAAPALARDTTLAAVYTKDSAVTDERSYNISGIVQNSDGSSVAQAAVEIGSYTGTTDNDGKFRIENVSSGTHTVVISDKDGVIIGHGTVTIAEAGDTVLTLTVDEQGNPVIVPAADTTDMELVLAIAGDGSISVRSVKDTAPDIPPGDGSGVHVSDTSSGSAAGGNVPETSSGVQTGDVARPLFCLLLIAAAGITADISIRKIKQKR